jgi:phenylpyruvate tautomerase PptA (4-oxalocrotonate tautomerase family)
MPIYTCTTTASTLGSDTKAALAREISEIHSAINHVPTSYVTVVFHELPGDAVYNGGVPASPVLVNSWVREGHPADETTRLATEVATAVTRVAGVPADQVTVVIVPGPARFAVEHGRVLPEPGHEAAWLAAEQNN